MQEPYSTGLTDFLAYLRACDELCRIAQDDEQRANDETQDILHSIELDKHSYNELAHLAKKMVTVRQKRREAKDTQETLIPIVEWTEKNMPVIKVLERILGDMRKAEKRQGSRLYAQRTDVLKEDA